MPSSPNPTPTDRGSRPTVLVTGAAGFVGSHLLDLLLTEDVRIVAWRRPDVPDIIQPAHQGLAWMAIEMLDREAVRRVIADIRPDAVYHLAGAPHVGQSWEKAHDTLAINVLATHHLFEALRIAGLTPRVLVPGSSYVYAPSADPLDESSPLGPASPYAFSKLAQELVAIKAATHDGIPAVVTRSFNHIGPRQAPSFFASGVAQQIARIEAGQGEPVLSVGNLDAQRDLTDVRDTVRAYRALMDRGRAGEVYNVCSGRAYAMRDVLNALLARARVPIEVRTDTARLRAHDTAVMVGNPGRLETDTGWRPLVPIEQTMADVLDYWRTVTPR
jgi:GDP-4-dehydro-6-deoxy-D-mannose reductase